MNITDLLILLGLASHDYTEKNGVLYFTQNEYFVAISQNINSVSVEIQKANEDKKAYVVNDENDGIDDLRNAVYDVIAPF